MHPSQGAAEPTAPSDPSKIKTAKRPPPPTRALRIPMLRTWSVSRSETRSSVPRKKVVAVQIPRAPNLPRDLAVCLAFSGQTGTSRVRLDADESLDVLIAMALEAIP
jgi:hypothetical protein